MYIQTKISKSFQEYSSSVHDENGVAVSRERLLKEFEGLVAHLIQSGNKRVAISLNHDYRYMIAICACMYAGVPYVPLKPEWPGTRVEQIRNLTEFSSIIDPQTYEKAGAKGKPSVPAAPKVGSEDPLYVLCTSGSTGLPKAVVIPRRAYENYVKWTESEFKDAYGPESKVIVLADYTFDMSLIDVALFLGRRPRMYFSNCEGNIYKLAQEIADYGITSLTSVPNTMNILLSDTVTSGVSLASLDHLLLGAARFSTSVYRAILEKIDSKTVVYNLYGPTESCVLTHYRKLTMKQDDVIDVNVSVGVPVPGVTCKLIDEKDAEITEANRTGHMLLGGKQLMLEYLKEPDKTRDVLVKRGGELFYKTGDLSFRDKNGSYFIVGRIDETLKRRGFRVNLLDIDAYLQKLDCIQDSLTIAIPDDLLEHKLISYVVLKDGAMTKNEVFARMKKVIVDFQIPDQIEIMAELPKNESGKISRKALTELYLSRTEDDRTRRNA